MAQSARAALEPNHSHFLFVDAGPAATGQFGNEIALRAAVEDSFCRVAEDNGVTTVMILLVVSGGVGTLTTVLTVLEKRRPVVVRFMDALSKRALPSSSCRLACNLKCTSAALLACSAGAF